MIMAALSVTGISEARADCDANSGNENCVGNAGNGPGDITEFNLAAGFGNGSGNGNVVFGPGLEFNLLVANAMLGVGNESGNANIIFGSGLAANVSALNFGAGIANGSGSGNVLFGYVDEDCLNGQPTVVTEEQATNSDTYKYEGNGKDGKDDGPVCSSAVKIAALNNSFGIGNRAFNGNVLGVGSSFVLEAENYASGVGNLSANANVVGTCKEVDGDEAEHLESKGWLVHQSKNDLENGSYKACSPAKSTSVLLNNTAFGNGTGSGNANALGGILNENGVSGDATLVMRDNRLFGNLTAAGNANALGDGGSAYAYIANNSIDGNLSGSFNGNGDNGYLEMTNNRVMGDESLSYNGNSEDGDGYAILNNNTVIGNRSLSNNAAGTYQNNIVMGDDSASYNQDGFSDNIISGHGSGNNAGENVTQNIVTGHGSGNGYGAGSTGNLTYGNNSGNNVGSDDNIAQGNNTGNNVSGDRNIAIGTGTGNNITANDTLAIGSGARATANNSSAIGAGAQANLPNQMVFGTTSETYTAPGITSGLSKARQSGPLEVVTSDANGNLATDGGATFASIDRNAQGIRENQEGVAVAMSVDGPDLVTNETFGISMQWANFEGSNAIGAGVTGVVYRGEKYRMALTGGIGVGLDESTVGGRAGGQLT